MELEKELSSIDHHTIKIIKKPKLKILIKDLDKDLKEDDILNELSSQYDLDKNKLKAIHIINKPEFKTNWAIVLLEKEMYDKIKDLNKLKIGFVLCRKMEYRSVLQCYNCCGFNHKATINQTKACNNNAKCMLCAGNHNQTNCNMKDKDGNSKRTLGKGCSQGGVASPILCGASACLTYW